MECLEAQQSQKSLHGLQPNARRWGPATFCEQRNSNQTVATAGGNMENSYRRKMTGHGMRKSTQEREEVER